MKKLSLLVALILCVTIGGVYATWHFSASNSVDYTAQEISFSMGDYKTEGSRGTYTVTSNFSIVVEPLDQVDEDTTVANANHIAALDFVMNADATGQTPTITITFTPGDYADADAVNFGVTTEFYLVDANEDDGNDPLSYTDINGETKNVLAFDYSKGNALVINRTDAQGDNVEKWTYDAENGVYTYTIDATEVIAIGGTFLIDTLAEYETFSGLLSGHNIVIRLNEQAPAVAA